MNLKEAFNVIRNEIDRHDYAQFEVIRSAAIKMVDSLEEYMEKIEELPTLNPVGKTVIRNNKGEVVGRQG